MGQERQIEQRGRSGHTLMDAHSKEDGDNFAQAPLRAQTQALKQRVNRDYRLKGQSHEGCPGGARVLVIVGRGAGQEGTGIGVARMGIAMRVRVHPDTGRVRVDYKIRLAYLVPKQPRNLRQQHILAKIHHACGKVRNARGQHGPCHRLGSTYGSLSTP